MWFLKKELNPINKNLNRLPEILYKYCRFDKKDHYKSLSLFGELYFPSAEKLNDPFEAVFIPKSKLLELNGVDLNHYLRDKALQRYPNSTEDEVLEIIKRGKEQKRLILEGNPKGMEAVLETQYTNFGICSLTPIRDSLPMWAYYSDSHKGLCIGLKVSSIAEHQQSLIPKEELLILHKVKYRKRMPSCNVDVNNNGMSNKELKELELTLYTKSKSWRHENEYRLLFYDQPKKPYRFGKNSVYEIILGANTDTDDNKIKQFIDDINSENPHVKIRKAIRSNNSYELNFLDIN